MFTAGKYTYAVFGDLAGLSRERLTKMFASHGAIETPGAHVVTFVWSSQFANSKFPRESFSAQCRAKNLLDSSTHEIITNKGYLHKAMARDLPRIYVAHFARTWPLLRFQYPERGVFIVRPTTTGFYGGKGIHRITHRGQLAQVISEYRTLGPEVAERAIVSEYLDDPYLVADGRKFHLRLYFMVRVDVRGTLSWDLFGAPCDDKIHNSPRAKIITAALPYVRDNYEDARIHDSHAKSTSEALFFPTHASQIKSSHGDSLDVESVWRQLHTICDALAQLLSAQPRGVRPYRESQCGFEIFGMDVMIVRRATADGMIDPCVVLIEVNDRVGYGGTPSSPLFDELQDAYFQWTWLRGYAPCLE